MESAELRELLTPEGVALLDSLPPYTSSTDVLKIVAALRKDGNSASLVATVLTQAKLRGKVSVNGRRHAVRDRIADHNITLYGAN